MIPQLLLLRWQESIDELFHHGFNEFTFLKVLFHQPSKLICVITRTALIRKKIGVLERRLTHDEQV
jgi:hypothetical protein